MNFEIIGSEKVDSEIKATNEISIYHFTENQEDGKGSSINEIRGR